MGDVREQHEHSSAAGAPGASAPGEQGYDGEVTVGEDALEASTAAHDSPAGRPGEVPDGPADVPPELQSSLDHTDRLLDGTSERG